MHAFEVEGPLKRKEKREEEKTLVRAENTASFSLAAHSIIYYVHARAGLT